MALGSFLSRLGSAALPAAISAYGTYRGGEEDERWKGLDPRTSQGLEGFMGAAQAGLSGLQRHEQEERAKKLERERAKQARIANLVGTISPRAGYRPAPVETPKAGALEQVAQLGGAGIGAYKSALEHSRALEDREQQRRQRELDIAKGEEEQLSRQAEQEIAGLTSKIGTALPVTKADEYATYKLTGEPPEKKVYGLADLRAEKSPHELGSIEDQHWKAEKVEAVNAEHLRTLTIQDKEASIAQRKAAAALAESNIPKAKIAKRVERMQAAAKNYGDLNPYATSEQLRSHLSDMFSAELEGEEFDITAYLPQAKSAFLDQQNQVQTEVSGFIDTAEKMAKDGNAAKSLAYFNAQLANAGVRATPEIMKKLGDSLARQENILDLNATTKEKLGTILFLETEMDDMLVKLSDKEFRERLAGEFGPMVQHWQAVEGWLDGEAGLKPENLDFLRRIQFSADMIARMQSGAALNDDEFRRYFKELLGGVGTDPEEFVVNLTRMRENLKGRKAGIFEVEKLGRGIGVDSGIMPLGEGEKTDNKDVTTTEEGERYANTDIARATQIANNKGGKYTSEQVKAALDVLIKIDPELAAELAASGEQAEAYETKGPSADLPFLPARSLHTPEEAQLREEIGQPAGTLTRPEIPLPVSGESGSLNFKNIADAADQNPPIIAGANTRTATVDSAIAPTLPVTDRGDKYAAYRLTGEGKDRYPTFDGLDASPSKEQLQRDYDQLEEVHTALLDRWLSSKEPSDEKRLAVVQARLMALKERIGAQ